MKQTEKGETFYVLINKEEQIHRLHLVLGVNLSGISLSIDYKIFQNECCMNSFVRGAFLSGGTLTNPDKAYHMEFATPRLRLSKDFMNLLSELDLSPKIITRKANHVIYFKDSAYIEDVLNIMGATKSEFELINTKILKEIRNSVNRVTNCETANITKMVQAAGEQINAIKKIMSSEKFDDLPEELKEVANKRLENDELSLSELGRILNPVLSKSAVNNRLRKIIEFSKKI
jgi:DNA-binding protein WhiA